MAKVLTAISVFFFIASISAVAGSYDLEYQNVWSGSTLAHVSPLIGADGELDGFVYADSAAREVVLDRWSSGPLIIPQSERPICTAHRIDPTDSSLLLYVLRIADKGADQEIRLYRVTRGEAALEIAVPLEFLSLAATSIRSSSLSIVPIDDTRNGVLVETVVSEIIDEKIGWSEQHLPYCVLLSGDLREEILRRNVSRLVVGDLVDDAELEMGWVDDHLSSWQYSVSAVNSTGAEKWQQFGISTVDSRALADIRSDGGVVSAMLIADFLPWMPNDEVLCAGDMEDLAGLYPGRRPHVGCYDLSSGRPREVWYREMPACEFTLVSQNRHFVAGMIANQSVIILDSWTGELIDSLAFDRPIASWTLFETNQHQPEIHLIGFRSDTMVVYRFDLAFAGSSARAGAEPELPPTFMLHQNYPNPFNGSTQIRFTSLESQRLSLKIYNVLGQEIAWLAESYFGVGEFEYHWDGADDLGSPQASGIYFAQLRSATQSQIIKLIYLK